MSGNRSIGHDARGGHLARAREALDRPTGPATAYWHARLEANDSMPSLGGYRHLAEDAIAEIAEQKARILAALPEALALAIIRCDIFDRERSADQLAAALAAAIEKVLESDSAAG